jgi:excisionase family DNA binding protein
MATSDTLSSDPSEMVSTSSAANILGVSPKTIYRMEKKGLIESVRTPGGQRRFRRQDLENYLDKSKTFVAPQNPSKYKANYSNQNDQLKEGSQEYLFDPSLLVSSPKPASQIRHLEQKVTIGESDDHSRYYDEDPSIDRWIDEWDFKTYNTKTYTHGFHTYPAMFIPQVARKLITAFSNEGDTICDIFCG